MNELRVASAAGSRRNRLRAKGVQDTTVTAIFPVVYVAEMGVHLAEEFARHENARNGIKYLGRARCWNADTNLRGTKKGPHGHGSGPDPVMASDRETKYLAELTPQAYLDAYSEALGAWKQGDHPVIFPFGTWKVVRHHAAVLGVPPPDFRR